MKKIPVILILIFACVLFACGPKREPAEGKEDLKIKAALSEGIKKIAFEELSDPGVDYAIFIKSLNGDFFDFHFGQSKQFPAASLLKIPILVAALQAVEEGLIAFDDKIVIEKKDITGGSGSLKAVKLPHESTVDKLLDLMISGSDNTATNKIINILGFDYLRRVFDHFDLKDTVLARHIMDMSMRNRGVENYTSARDIARIFELLYRGEIVSKDLSDKAMVFLLRQKVGDRIPKLLPEEVRVAHKTGLERGVIHDAGIVFGGQRDYLICVLVKNERSYQKGKNFIALVSLLTYNLTLPAEQ